MHSQQSLDLECEQAIRLLVANVPPSDEQSRKPALIHALRVGVYLYQREYSREIILAGFLHDAVEWAGIHERAVREAFGERVASIVTACTKDDSIKKPVEKINELIGRCVANGHDALIVKAADIIDSFSYYSRVQNERELLYCRQNAEAIARLKPESFIDPVFAELFAAFQRHR
ncbi:MAG: HD domain-containing protein [Patescibacteria group bacterium]